jgi:predicted nuclease of predicted toxin-antitoxin system
MKIVADENCDGILVAALRSSGFDVIWIREASPGIDDVQIYEIATAGERVLLTSDQGFGVMAERMGPPRPAGIVLMRLERLLPATRADVAIQALTTLGDSLIGQFTVVGPHRVRSRSYTD